MQIHLIVLLLAKLIHVINGVPEMNGLPEMTAMSLYYQSGVVHNEIARYRNLCIVEAEVKIHSAKECSILIKGDNSPGSMHPFIALRILHALPARTQGWTVEINWSTNLHFRTTTKAPEAGEVCSKRYVQALDGDIDYSHLFQNWFEWEILMNPELLPFGDLQARTDKAAQEFMHYFGPLFRYSYSETVTDMIAIIIERPPDLPIDSVYVVPIGAAETFAHILHASINGVRPLHINVLHKYAFTVEQVPGETTLGETKYQEASLAI